MLGVVKNAKINSLSNYLLHAHYKPDVVLQPQNTKMHEA